MRYIAWVLKLAVFVLLLTLAMQNGEIVRLVLLPGVAWDAPLILFLLIFFAVGAVLGLLGAMGYSLRLHRELTRLKKELRARQTSQVLHDPSDALGD